MPVPVPEKGQAGVIAADRKLTEKVKAGVSVTKGNAGNFNDRAFREIGNLDGLAGWGSLRIETLGILPT